MREIKTIDALIVLQAFLPESYKLGVTGRSSDLSPFDGLPACPEFIQDLAVAKNDQRLF
jgi:hypothetical protein